MAPSAPSSGCPSSFRGLRSEEHTSELQSQSNLVCRLLLEKKKTNDILVATFTEPGSTPYVPLPAGLVTDLCDLFMHDHNAASQYVLASVVHVGATTRVMQD